MKENAIVQDTLKQSLKREFKKRWPFLTGKEFQMRRLLGFLLSNLCLTIWRVAKLAV